MILSSISTPLRQDCDRLGAESKNRLPMTATAQEQSTGLAPSAHAVSRPLSKQPRAREAVLPRAAARRPRSLFQRLALGVNSPAHASRMLASLRKTFPDAANGHGFGARNRVIYPSRD
jgi:hypothetical protein